MSQLSKSLKNSRFVVRPENIVNDQDFHAGKPDPEPYATAFDVMARRVDGLQRLQCVAIEDSLPGLESAAAAGLPVVAVPHVRPLPADPRWEHWTSLAGRLPADLGRAARRLAGGSCGRLQSVPGGRHGNAP